MEGELEEYVDYPDQSTISDQCQTTEIMNRNLFPELWDIEMETLQIENELENEKYGNRIKINAVIEPQLTDYVDSEDDLEDDTEKSNTPSVNESTFPPMWELELEIFNCDNLTNPDVIRIARNTKNHKNFEENAIFSETSPSAESNGQPIKNESILLDKDIELAGSMFQDLMLSSICQTKENELIDIPCKFQSLNL